MGDLEPIFNFLQQAKGLEAKDSIEAATKVRPLASHRCHKT